MKEQIALTIGSIVLAATAAHAVENPRPISQQAQIFLTNRAAVLPPKEDLTAKVTETQQW